MSFISLQYIIFIGVTWLVFRLLPASKRIYALLAASYVFYGAWSIPCLFLILFTTSVDFFLAKIMCGSEDNQTRKRCLAAGVTVNLLVLCLFKYANFLFSSQYSLMQMLGIETTKLHLDIILPLGISFYTFEAISFLIDVYRKRTATPTWLYYNFYIMFFPHLIAGPIVRFNKLFKQYESGISLPTANRLRDGLELLVLGFASKLIVADSFASYCQSLQSRSASLSVLEAFCLAISMVAQLWFDFQGYTNIARGTANLFNIELPINFNWPGVASNIADFWQRWNITLSQWLFDYLYVPLGGLNRKLSTRMRCAFFTMLLAGIWHGAGLNYVLLGIYFGLLVAAYHAYRHWLKSAPQWFQDMRKQSKLFQLAAIAGTQYLLLFAGLLFFPQLDLAATVAKRLIPFGTGFIAPDKAWMIDPIILGPTILLALYCLSYGHLERFYKQNFCQSPMWIRVPSTTFVVILCVIFEANRVDPNFIYAQF